MQKYAVNNFFVNVSVLAVVFRLQFSKNRQLWLKLLTYFANNFKKKDHFSQNCRFFENCRRNTTASMETFTKNYLRHTFALHFTSYLSIALSKIRSYSETIIKKLKNCQYLVKRTLAVYLIFYKPISFETLNIFLESKIKLTTGIFDFQK